MNNFVVLKIFCISRRLLNIIKFFRPSNRNFQDGFNQIPSFGFHLDFQSVDFENRLLMNVQI